MTVSSLINDLFGALGGGVFRNALIGTILLSLSSSMVGSFTMLRKQSLITDVIAHSVFPGVCLGFLLTNERNLLVILLCASITGWIASLFVEWFKKHPKIAPDTASAITLSTFFGGGVMLLVYLINSPTQSVKSGISSFLYGSVIGISNQDIIIFFCIVILLISLIFLFYKELVVFSFDERFAQSIGYPISFLKILLSIITVIAIVIGIQAVGVILIASLLITPSVIARFWTHRINWLIVLACGIGVSCALIGTTISYHLEVSTGPWIVMTISTVALISFLFAPQKGIISKVIRHKRFKKTMTQENMLKALYHYFESKSLNNAFSIKEVINFKVSQHPTEVNKTLNALTKQGYLTQSKTSWNLTKIGFEKGQRLVKLHRLWELYLTEYLNIQIDHVHEDADSIEHIITPEIEKQLEEKLGRPTTDPHNQKIPYKK